MQAAALMVLGLAIGLLGTGVTVWQTWFSSD
jgi:hypothetical protein